LIYGNWDVFCIVCVFVNQHFQNRTKLELHKQYSKFLNLKFQLVLWH